MTATVKTPSKGLRPGSGSKCLVPACGRSAERRGCCRACYASFWRQVRDKKISWKKLENNGLILPAERGKVSAAARAVRNLKGN